MLENRRLAAIRFLGEYRETFARKVQAVSDKLIENGAPNPQDEDCGQPRSSAVTWPSFDSMSALVDRVYLPGQKNPIPLKSSTTSLYLLARLRDEAHRFSNKAREKLGKKRRFHSALDDVKGLGPAAKKALLMRYGSVPTIIAAPDAELLDTPGVAARHVKALRAVFPAPAKASTA